MKPQKYNNTFDFFKKDEKVFSHAKNVHRRLSFFLAFFLCFQAVGVVSQHNKSKIFQEKEIPIVTSKGYVNIKNMDAFLEENLNKKTLNYDEMTTLIKGIKGKKGEIPFYVYSHLIQKIHDNNESLYANSVNQLKSELLTIEHQSVLGLISPNSKNLEKYNQYTSSLKIQHDLIEEDLKELDPVKSYLFPKSN